MASCAKSALARLFAIEDPALPAETRTGMRAIVLRQALWDAGMRPCDCRPTAQTCQRWRDAGVQAAGAAAAATVASVSAERPWRVACQHLAPRAACLPACLPACAPCAG